MAKEKKDNAVKKAMEVIKKAMIDDNPGEAGSYAHSWHCNIAMMCYDAMADAAKKTGAEFDYVAFLEIGNDAASRFMKLCFDVETRR